MLDLQLGDDVTDRWGNTYTDIIEEIDYFDLKQQFADDVDSLVTLFTREKVGHVDALEHLFLQMIITSQIRMDKNSRWSDRKVLQLSYFSRTGHLNQIVYPSYFLPVGFYFSPNDIEDGFWHKKNLESEVLYYTSNGYLRDGEMVDTAY